MCTKDPKEVPVIEDKAPSNFAIRDLTPQDLLDIPEITGVPATSDSAPKPNLTANGEVISIGLVSGTAEVAGPSKSTSKRVKRQYFLPPGMSYASPNDEIPDKSLKYIPPHKLSSAVRAAPFFKGDFPPLPPTKPVPPIPSAEGKRRDGVKGASRVSRKNRSDTAQVEMDSPGGQGSEKDRVNNERSAIEDLTHAFVQKASVSCDPSRHGKLSSEPNTGNGKTATSQIGARLDWE